MPVSTVDPLIPRDMFQDTQWMPETTDSTKPYIYWVFFPLIHSYHDSLIYKLGTMRDLTTNNETEQL